MNDEITSQEQAREWLEKTWGRSLRMALPTFDNFSNEVTEGQYRGKKKGETFKIYEVPPRWRKLPFFLVRLFFKPTVLKNCYWKSFGQLTMESDGVINIPVTFSFEEKK